MNILVVGGTGFLGYYTIQAALARGHQCGSLAIDDIPLGDWFPREVRLHIGNVFEMDEDAIAREMEGYDAMVYSVGPDDRVTPMAPAYDFFHERLVEHCAKTFRAARKAGVKRAVAYNSYFATFDRLHPEKKLTEYHPYIRCRVEQATRLLDEAGGMDVMILELPYIFGSMPERTPLWRDVFLERFFRAPVVCFPAGGTTMIHVEHVGEAGVGALMYGTAGERYPIGDENHTYLQMLQWFEEGLGIKKPILLVNKCLCAMGAGMIARKDAREGKQAGLDMKRLMLDIMGEELYIPQEEIDRVAGRLRFGRGKVREGILETMKACYPDGF